MQAVHFLLFPLFNQIGANRNIQKVIAARMPVQPLFDFLRVSDPEIDHELINGDGPVPHHLLKVAASANMASLQPRRTQIISV
ncbi:hypothetical protein FHT85_005697 [Rhizobium sp. BK312]|uniref:hypothetical protein n=1 Tax=Rhizobium sp. BK312 TaxID=2587080 RepID=UPI0013AF14F2|nr:hypothetical protein [Rhizobium sp. BK312]MBB3428671.1 hypothetical protein [Rhizobium sp. BK312]